MGPHHAHVHWVRRAVLIRSPKCQDDGVVSARVGGSDSVSHFVSPPGVDGVHVDGIGRLADLIKKGLVS